MYGQCCLRFQRFLACLRCNPYLLTSVAELSPSFCAYFLQGQVISVHITFVFHHIQCYITIITSLMCCTILFLFYRFPTTMKYVFLISLHCFLASSSHSDFLLWEYTWSKPCIFHCVCGLSNSLHLRTVNILGDFGEFDIIMYLHTIYFMLHVTILSHAFAFTNTHLACLLTQ